MSKNLPNDKWERLYPYYKQQLEKMLLDHSLAGKDRKDWRTYVKELEDIANLRDEIMREAQKAQSAKKDKIFNDLMNLVDRSQDEGNSVLGEAGFLFRLEDSKGGDDGWANWILRSETNGIPIYDKAKQREFDESITRQHVKNLIKESIKDLKHGYENLPSDLWPYGNVEPRMVDYFEDLIKLRNLSEHFELDEEYKNSNEMFNDYLKDACCLLPRGHKYYFKLAKKYDLKKAKKYLEDYYAIIHGKVEIQDKEGRKPASNAIVRVFAPKDNQEWVTNTDKEGEYMIKKVLLHKNCSPFQITAESGQYAQTISFEGPLEEDPSPDYEHEINLLITKNDWTGMLFYNKLINNEDLTESESPPDGSGHPTFMQTKIKNYVNIKANLPLNLRRSQFSAFQDDNFTQKEFMGNYSLAFKQETIFKKTKDQKTRKKTTLKTATCSGKISRNISDIRRGFGIISFTINEKQGNYDMRIAFTSDNKCKANSSIHVNGEEISKSSYDLDFIRFDSKEMLNFVPPDSFSGKIEDNKIYGRCSLTQKSSGGRIGGYHGVTVEWNLKKNKVE